MELEQQLRTALTPARPGPQVRAVVMARLAAGAGRRGVNRWVLGGAVLALGVAAAMLAMRLPDPGSPAPVVESSTVPAAPQTLAPATPSSPSIAATGASPATAPPDLQPAPATPGFTVLVLPLESDEIDPPRKAAMEAVHAGLVDALRAVPGLTLVKPAADASGSSISANYRITLEGRVNPVPDADKGDFHIGMIAARTGPDGRQLGAYHTGMSGKIAAGCASPSQPNLLEADTSCADTAGVVAGLLATLRKAVFPPDPQLQRQLQARLADQAIDPARRLRALSDLHRLGRSSGVVDWKEFAPALRDPAMIRAAIQLASTTPDPATRAEVWYTLRGSRDPALVPPLVAALRGDVDTDVRVQALATLAADFPADPAVRVALETAAAGDADPMVRALAHRELGSESTWMEYVVASLKDAGRPAVERIEAFFYAYGLPTSRNYGSYGADGRILRALGDAGMRALTEVLPRAAADSPRYAHASLTLVSSLSLMDHPAITDMLLEAVGPGGPAILQGLAIEGLQRRAADPRVRAALAGIAAQHANPEFREQAGKALSTDAIPAAAPAGPPRLGVMTDYVKAAPDVPGELVGKLVIMRMGTGSVAERAGMKEADVLLEIDGKPIASGPQLIEVLDALPRDVDLDVLVSRSGQTMRLTARF